MFSKGKNIVMAGFYGPIIFALIILIAGYMYPNYSHVNQVISDLGAVDSPVKDFMNFAGFMLFGLSVMAFAVGVYKIRKTNLGKIISALFFIGGLSMFLVGVFPSDAPCPQGPRFCPPPTATSGLHELATVGQFPFLFAAFILLVVDTRNEKSMKYYFAVAGVMGLLIAYFANLWINADSNILVGVNQRVTLGLYSLLLMYTAWKLSKLK